jgi:hypothetical protein
VQHHRPALKPFVFGQTRRYGTNRPIGRRDEDKVRIRGCLPGIATNPPTAGAFSGGVGRCRATAGEPNWQVSNVRQMPGQGDPDLPATNNGKGSWFHADPSSLLAALR